MKYYVEEDASAFNFWSGARENISTAIELGTDDQVFAILEELFYDGNASDTQINDYVWFNMPVDYPELFGEDDEDGEDDDYDESDDDLDTTNESKKTSGNRFTEEIKRIALIYSNEYYSREKIKEVENTIREATGLSRWGVLEWTERSMALTYSGDPSDLTPELIATAKKIFKEML